MVSSSRMTNSPRREQALGPGEVEQVGDALRADEVGAPEHAVGDVGGLVAEDEDAASGWRLRPLRPPAVAIASITDMSRLLNGTRAWRGRGAERGEGAAVLLDDDPVAGAQRDVDARVVVEVLEPDAPGPAAALELDLRDVGDDATPPACASIAESRRVGAWIG